MALVHNVNVAATSGDQMIYLLLTTLLSAGWTVPSSSDGTTYNATGNQLSSSGSGAGGLGNSSAWFVVRDPAGRRELCVQRGTANTSFRVKYSALAKFSDHSSAGATQVPLASDERITLGGGSDASPTYVIHFVASPTGRFHVVASDTAVNGVFWFWYAQIDSSIVTRSNMVFDALLGTHADDVEPCYVANSTTAAGSAALTLSNLTSTGKSWTRYGLSGASWSTSSTGPTTIGTFFGAASGGVANPYSGEDDAVECPTGSSTIGYKGRSTIVKAATPFRNYPATWNLTDANLSSVRIDGALLRWPTGVAPLS